MSNSPSALTSIRWNEVFPWVALVRAARVALMARVIVLALVGVILTQLGWALIDRVLLDLPAEAKLARLTDRDPPRLWWTPTELRLAPPQTSIDLDAMTPPSGSGLSQGIAAKLNPGGLFDAVDARRYAGPAVRGWTWAMQPFTRLVEAATWRNWFGFLVAGLWTIAVWALFGGAIARIAGLYLARGETVGPLDALRTAAAKSLSTAGAPAFCLLVIGLLGAMLAVAGFFIRLNLLALLVGLVWFLIILGGLAIALVAIGLMLGWPFMWSTIAVERTDAFDGISRGYAYVFQRPLHLIFYLIVTCALGLLAQAAVSVLADASLKATNWAVSGGAGDVRLKTLLDPPTTTEGESSLGVIDRTASKAIRFWTLGVLWTAAAFPMAYLWPAATGVYLLLRRSIDSTEMTEASVDESPPQRGLPALAPDPATGVPQVAPDAGSPTG